MPRLAHIVARGDPHHVTQRGVRSLPIVQGFRKLEGVYKNGYVRVEIV